MVSIQKKGNSYYVVYASKDELGKAKTVWESYRSEHEAKRRKAIVEAETTLGMTSLPIGKEVKSVAQFMEQFVRLYGEAKWGAVSYSNNLALINNYINPLIGGVALWDVKPLLIQTYYQQLKVTRPVETNFKQPNTQHVSPRTREKIHKLLKCAFKQAVRWELISSNPFDLIDYEKPDYDPIAVWTVEQVALALEQCDDPRLFLILCLAFCCTLRVGEILGLSWDNVHLSEPGSLPESYLWIDKTLQRVSVEALRKSSKNDIIKEFAPKLLMHRAAKTVLILKKPKTRASIRRVFLPPTAIQVLHQHKLEQNKIKQLFGASYQEHDLVICNHDGTPYEEQMVLKSFRRLIQKTGLPPVVFHSIRHTSTSYKLLLSKGDIKSVQADTGHASPDQIMKRYARAFDNQRQINTQMFEDAFFAKHDEYSSDMQTREKLIKMIKQMPELRSLLREML